MLEARQLGRADVEKESVALPRLTFKSTQRGWPAGTQASDVTECIQGEECALHAMTSLIQFEEHEVYDRVRRAGHVTSDRGNRARQVSDNVGYVGLPPVE
jgi:hypothetical protein